MIIGTRHAHPIAQGRNLADQPIDRFLGRFGRFVGIQQMGQPCQLRLPHLPIHSQCDRQHDRTRQTVGRAAVHAKSRSHAVGHA